MFDFIQNYIKDVHLIYFDYIPW